MKFENKTIIITDPCYIIKKYKEFMPNWFEWDGLKEVSPYTPFIKYTKEQLKAYESYKKAFDEYYDKYDDWRKCEYGDNIKVLGITHYLCRSIIYGDWSWTTYNSDTNEVLGHFCTDTGLIAVFDLEEVLEYNPNFNKWIEEHSRCVTKIPNFTGEVSIEVVDISNQESPNGGFENKEVRVIGKGNINFYTTQTGL